MRIAIIGQQDFGKAALEAFLARGDTVAAVFCAPDGGRPDPLRLAADAAGIPVFQFPRLTDPAAQAALRDARVDLAVMAYVTQFAPQAFCSIPTHGTIQFHPSLLPLHRGASSMSWAIMLGRSETGFSIFRPVDGLDEGPVILQRSVPIGPEETRGARYLNKIFPQGIAGLLDATDQVIAGTAAETPQPATGAGYEGIVGEAESRIHWHSHVDITFNLIRGCNPAPGAWTPHNGRKLVLFDCHKRIASTFGAIKRRKVGQVVAVDADGVAILGQGGFIIVQRLRWDGGKKIAAADAGLEVGAILDT